MPAANFDAAWLILYERLVSPIPERPQCRLRKPPSKRTPTVQIAPPLAGVDPKHPKIKPFVAIIEPPVQKSVSVVVVNWNRVNLLRACLASLAAQTLNPLEVIVVDNGSSKALPK